MGAGARPLLALRQRNKTPTKSEVTAVTRTEGPQRKRVVMELSHFLGTQKYMGCGIAGAKVLDNSRANQDKLVTLAGDGHCGKKTNPK